MKPSLVLFSLLLGVVSAAGAEHPLVAGKGESPADVEERRANAMGSELERFKTMTGRIYREVTITRIDDGGISFRHADGVARLRFEDLRPEQRRYYGIVREKAAEIYREELEARLAFERKVRIAEEARAKAAEEEAEARRLAEETAAKERAERFEAVAFRSIPALPDVRRVDSRSFSRRAHYRPPYFVPGYFRGYHYSGGYYPRHRFTGGVRFGNPGKYCGSRFPGIVIRR